MEGEYTAVSWRPHVLQLAIDARAGAFRPTKPRPPKAARPPPPPPTAPPSGREEQWQKLEDSRLATELLGVPMPDMRDSAVSVAERRLLRLARRRGV